MSFALRGLLAASLGLTALLSGCGSFKKAPTGPTKAEVFAAASATVDCSAPDDDNDGLPNDVERRFQSQLGTDPEKADSDGDGIDDGFEVFGPSWLYLHSCGRAGTLAGDEPAAVANDAKRDHAAELVDSDGDGVPDYLETEGYIYDWRQARFVLDPNGFHTDPLQWSTDQDAYSDGMEVSGINMDVAVKPPGNHPLVPAYPDIVIELTGYSLAINEQITDGTGGQLDKGTSWSHEVTNEHSTGFEKGITVGAEYKFGVDGGLTLKAEASAKWSSSDTRSETVSSGGSFTESVNWDRARSYSPIDAARIKLFVRVHNRGTAPASNLVPTINMRIAGANVSSFEPELPIYMLLPGAAYPPDPGTTLVLDHDSAGNPLSLTDWELRALQRGAPITLAVMQKKADVMRLTRDGAWERVGDVNEYLARIVSVSASISLDLGLLPDRGDQARQARRLVYAGHGPTAPPVTLAEALHWTDDLTGDADAGFTLDYQRDDGSTTSVPLEASAANDGAWRVQVDPVTLEHGWPYGTVPATAGAVFDLPLLPGSQVSLRAPRPQESALPTIHNAYAVPSENGYQVTVCATDYDAIARVLFIDKNGREVELLRDGRGPAFYSASLAGYAFRSAQDASTTPEQVVVESERTVDQGGTAVPLTATSGLEVVYTPVAQPPVLGRVAYDNKLKRFYARIEPGGELALDQVDWVRLYHPDLKEGATPGYRSLGPTIFVFEDPNGWEVTLDAYRPGMRLVAYTVGGKYTARDVGEMQDLNAYRSGTLWVKSGSVQNVIDENEFWTPAIDFDAPVPADECLYPNVAFDYRYLRNLPSGAWMNCVAADPRQETYFREWDEFLGNDPSGIVWDWWRTLPDRPGVPDLYVRTTYRDTADFIVGYYFSGKAVDVPVGMTSANYFNNVLGYPELLVVPNLYRGPHGGGTGEVYNTLQRDMIVAFETSDGRLGKARVSDVIGIDEYPEGWSYTEFVRFDYVVYPRAQDFQAPSGMQYSTPSAVYSVGRAIDPPNAPSFAAGDLPTGYRLCLASSVTTCFDRTTILPTGMLFDAKTGVISGIPTQSLPATWFTVTAWNDGGQISANIQLEVLQPPSGLTYSPAIVSCPTGHVCSIGEPTVTGSVSRFSIAPTLPVGLVLNTLYGSISGTPSVITNPADYLVTGSNLTGATTTALLRLGTPLGAPGAIVYPGAPYVFVVGDAITSPRTPMALGGRATWTVSPSLPGGLSLDPDTGAIYGTPTEVKAATDYEVTVTNLSGVATATVNVRVDAAP